MVCPGVRVMCEMFCPPYISDPVLVQQPVIGMTAVGTVAVDGIVMVIVALAVPAPDDARGDTRQVERIAVLHQHAHLIHALESAPAACTPLRTC